VPLIIDGIKAILDFHNFDVLDLDLLLGSPMKKFLDITLGSLDHKLRESASTTSIIDLGPLLVKPFPNQDPVEKLMHVSPLASPEPVLIEVVDFSSPQKNDSEDAIHFCEGERSPSLSTGLSLFPLARMMLLSIMIESRYRAFIINILR
jgi:hypothetical protein